MSAWPQTRAALGRARRELDRTPTLDLTFRTVMGACFILGTPFDGWWIPLWIMVIVSVAAMIWELNRRGEQWERARRQERRRG